MKKLFVILSFSAFYFAAFASPKKVLIELLTNSHCPLCPPAHSALDSYFQNGTYKDKIILISYHMLYPYSDDLLYQNNTADAAARNSFYGPYSSTPQGFFNGSHQSNTYANWASSIDSKAEEDSPFEIMLSGSGSLTSSTISASIKQTETTAASNFSVYFVAVENVNYSGRNGISYHKNVMRKMFPGNSGNAIVISQNETISVEETLDLNSDWVKGQLGFVVFIQDNSTKTVYQAEYISYINLIKTDVVSHPEKPNEFFVSQNYPNPFNPTTKISYYLPKDDFAQLIIYDVLGRRISTMVNKFENLGNHSVDFDGSGFSGGLYFYKLISGKNIFTGKMVLKK